MIVRGWTIDSVDLSMLDTVIPRNLPLFLRIQGHLEKFYLSVLSLVRSKDKASASSLLPARIMLMFA